jgi:hypothetical protein
MDYGDRLAYASSLGFSGMEREAFASSGVPLPDQEDDRVEAECGHMCDEREIGSDGKCVNCTEDK